MENEVERDGDTARLKPVEHAEFLGVGFGAGEFIGGIFACSLEAELEVIEAGGDELVEAGFIEWKAGSNEIHVEPGCACGLDEFGEVGAS